MKNAVTYFVHKGCACTVSVLRALEKSIEINLPYEDFDTTGVWGQAGQALITSQFIRIGRINIDLTTWKFRLHESSKIQYSGLS